LKTTSLTALIIPTYPTATTTQKETAAKGVRGLCLGASQKPKSDIKDGAARCRNGSAFEEVRKDVQVSVCVEVS